MPTKLSQRSTKPRSKPLTSSICSASMCIACEDRPRAVRNRPCGHAVFCSVCTIKAIDAEHKCFACPTCRAEVTHLQLAGKKPALKRMPTFEEDLPTGVACDVPTVFDFLQARATRGKGELAAAARAAIETWQGDGQNLGGGVRVVPQLRSTTHDSTQVARLAHGRLARSHWIVELAETPPRDLARLRSAFASLDSRRTGQVPRHMLQPCLRQGGIELTPAQVREALEMFSTREYDGRFDWTRFLEQVESPRRQEEFLARLELAEQRDAAAAAANAHMIYRMRARQRILARGGTWPPPGWSVLASHWSHLEA